MSSRDPLDFAKLAINRVAVIAVQTGVQHGNTLCGRLGSELLLTADYLDTAGLYNEDKLRLRVSKLLRDVEKICSWPSKLASKSGYSLLRALAHAQPGSVEHHRVVERIKKGILSVTSNTHFNTCCQAIAHLQALRGYDRDLAETESGGNERNSLPADYPSDIDALTYRVLCDYMLCACDNNRTPSSSHFLQLSLHAPRGHFLHGQVCLDMLISSTSYRSMRQFGIWQDTQIAIPWGGQKRKQVGFSDLATERSQTVVKSHEPLEKSSLCDLLHRNEGSRICLKIENDRLCKSGFVPLEQIVEHVPGISLAEILTSGFRLTQRMKLAFAYILSLAVWQFYDSNWMNIRWTSDTICFMRHRDKHSQGCGRLYVWRPYLAFRFCESDSSTQEHSDLDEIHSYPRIRALGIMLIEVALGVPYRTDDPRRQSVNGEYLLGMESVINDSLWEKLDLDIPKFRNSIKCCFDPLLFQKAPFEPQADAENLAKSLQQRKKIIYEEVVSPLENLLRGMDWIDQINKIGPLEENRKSSRQNVPSGEQADDNTVPGSAPAPQTTSRIKSTGSEFLAKKYLRLIQHLNHELKGAASSIPQQLSPTRVRIAILDTGCDDDATIFHLPGNSARLKGRKDWVTPSGSCQDVNGHGTYLASLILRVAPEAEIYIARVAENPAELIESGDKVAQAITWASTQWKADIVSMSFGYAEEQISISNAIREALWKREAAVLFFAAASNSGAREHEMWPAKQQSVISVRATNYNGEFLDMNPPKDKDQQVLGTLGLDVPSSALSDQGDEVHRSGTSVATAIVAGMAAILLHYVSTKRSETAFPEVNRKIRTQQGMQDMLHELANNSLRDGYKYLTPSLSMMGISEEARWAKFVAKLSR